MRNASVGKGARWMLAIALVGIVWQSTASSAVVTIGSSRDATIFSNNPTFSLGGGVGIFSGTNTGATPRRGLMGFDIAAAVPAGSTITDVQLKLFLAQVAGGGMGGGGGTPTIELHRLSADWGEGINDNGNNSPGGTGQGFAANNGDVTWNSRFHSTTAWSTAGGDFSATISASTTITGTTLDAPYTWGSTSGMIVDVQNWLDTPSSNFGWLLKNTDETTSQTFRAFWTRETSRVAAKTAFVPQLQITFIPEPSILAPSIALMAFAVRRRGR